MTYLRHRLTEANGSNDIVHNPTYFVRTEEDGGHDSYDGVEANKPLATIQCAVDKVKDEIDTNGFAPVIRIHDGLHMGWQDYGPNVGRHKRGGGPTIFMGNPLLPSAVKIFRAMGVAPISYDGFAQGVFIGMEVIGNKSQAIYATGCSVIECGFVRVSGPIGFLADSGAKILGTSNLYFKGSMVYGGMGNKAGLFECVPGIHVFFEGSTFSEHFLFGTNHGMCIVPYHFLNPVYNEKGEVISGTQNPAGGVTFHGSFVGSKGFASLQGIINSGYMTYNLFPGTIDCDTNKGGQLN